jgi:hypothetical protein
MGNVASLTLILEKAAESIDANWRSPSCISNPGQRCRHVNAMTLDHNQPADKTYGFVMGDGISDGA